MASVFQRTQVHQAKEILTGLGAAKSSGRIGFCPTKKHKTCFAQFVKISTVSSLFIAVDQVSDFEI